MFGAKKKFRRSIPKSDHNRIKFRHRLKRIVKYTRKAHVSDFDSKIERIKFFKVKKYFKRFKKLPESGSILSLQFFIKMQSKTKNGKICKKFQFLNNE